MRLEGKIALVTGADSGIGRATALTFAREGADVAVHYNTDRRGAEQTAEGIRRHGRKVDIIEADFTDPSVAETLVAQVIERMGGLDILVNNAGMGKGAETSLDIPTQDFIDVLNVDLVVPFILAREAGKLMARQGFGSIINVTSVHEAIPQKGSAAYCAAKGGLKMVTKTLALDLASSGVRVNNVAPGMIATPMTASTLHDADAAERAEQKIPMGRAGQQQDIANVVLFLASDEAAYVTGSTYFADGGLTLHVQGT